MNKKLAIFIILGQMLSVASPVLAAEFNPHFIISDFDMTQADDLGLYGIQKFLEDKGSFLHNFVGQDIDGGNRTAAEMIFLAALKNKINPKVILVTLQKEQSLVETAAPTQYQLDWATGYGRCDNLDICGPDSPLVQKYRGFAKQIDYVAGAMRFFLDNPSKGSFQVGQTSLIDGQQVTPINQATANLYIYTPHLHGNLNFYGIWNRWFSQLYPDGTLLVESESRDAWLIQDGRRRKIAKAAASSRFDLKKAITVDKKTLEFYQIGKPIKFPQYSLLQNEDGGIYLLVGDEIRPIVSERVFKTIGYSLDEVIELNNEDLANFTEGQPITLETVYPTGALLQNNISGGIYFVENNIKHPIWSRELMKARFSGFKNIIKVAPERLSQIDDGEPIKFSDGELVKSDAAATVYVIADSKKRAIHSGEVFESLGYKWENIIVTNDKVLALHPEGEAIK